MQQHDGHDAQVDDGPAWHHQIRLRIAADVINEATIDYWQRRATTFDHVGTPTGDATAQACRNHAAFLGYLATGELP